MDMPAAPNAIRDRIRRHGYLTAVGSVVLATSVFAPFRESLGREQWGWLYLLVLGFVAGTAGVGPAVLSAVLSFFAWNFFFIPPFHTLLVAERGDVVHLGVYLVVSVAVGLQTGRLRDREAVAQREERHAAALNRLSTSLVSETSTEGLASAAAEELTLVVGASSVELWIPDESTLALVPVTRHEQETVSPPDDIASMWALAAGGVTGHGRPPVRIERQAADATPSSHRLLLPLVSAASVEGLLEVTLDAPPDDASASFVTALAHLLAAFLQSRRLNAVAMQAAAEREAERLRSAVVSSVSHELKTPLASITAAVTDLLETDVHREPDDVRRKLGDVEEDLHRLDDAIADLLDVSRLEAQAWQPRPTEFEVGELVGAVVTRLPRASRERVTYAVPEGLPMLHLDFVQLSRALHHVIGNALEYSDGIVTVGAAVERDMLLWVDDSGPGIPESEKDLVFDKFYRGTSGRALGSSTGLGLSIAREIIWANGGEIAIEGRLPHGTRILLRLPREREDA
jgi:two-component system sensor histidine kinase KdpD